MYNMVIRGMITSRAISPKICRLDTWTSLSKARLITDSNLTERGINQLT